MALQADAVVEVHGSGCVVVVIVEAVVVVIVMQLEVSNTTQRTNAIDRCHFMDWTPLSIRCKHHISLTFPVDSAICFLVFPSSSMNPWDANPPNEL
jgi:hypothetical protein